MDHEAIKEAIVKVGGGRGFVVEIPPLGKVIVTAAHCLPELPTPHAAQRVQDRTFATLLGPLDKEPSVWAECLFADVMGDIAVLSAPDNQDLSQECEAYEALVKDRPTLAIGRLATASGWLLRLNGELAECRPKSSSGGRFLWLEDAVAVASGMSGSPILATDGRAVGVISTGRLNPTLMGLPGWLIGTMFHEEKRDHAENQ